MNYPALEDREPWSKITVLYPTYRKETKIRNYKKQVKL